MLNPHLGLRFCHDSGNERDWPESETHLAESFLSCAGTRGAEQGTGQETWASSSALHEASFPAIRGPFHDANL